MGDIVKFNKDNTVDFDSYKVIYASDYPCNFPYVYDMNEDDKYVYFYCKYVGAFSTIKEYKAVTKYSNELDGIKGVFTIKLDKTTKVFSSNMSGLTHMFFASSEYADDYSKCVNNYSIACIYYNEFMIQKFKENDDFMKEEIYTNLVYSSKFNALCDESFTGINAIWFKNLEDLVKWEYFQFLENVRLVQDIILKGYENINQSDYPDLHWSFPVHENNKLTKDEACGYIAQVLYVSCDLIDYVDIKVTYPDLYKRVESYLQTWNEEHGINIELSEVSILENMTRYISEDQSPLKGVDLENISASMIQDILKSKGYLE